MRPPLGEQRGAPCTPCARRCPGGCRGPAACGSSPGRCGRPRARAAGYRCPPKLRWRMRPSAVRSNSAPHASSSRTRSGASFACSSAMRQLLRYWPPRMVSAKCTCQLSRSSTLASAAAMPPSAITVCALPSSDLQTSPTDAPARRRRDRRAQPGAAGADDQDVVLEGLVARLRGSASRSRCPSSRAGRRCRRRPRRTGCTRPSACGRG